MKIIFVNIDITVSTASTTATDTAEVNPIYTVTTTVTASTATKVYPTDIAYTTASFVCIIAITACTASITVIN